MQQDILLEPSGFSPRLRELVAQLDLPDPDRQALLHLEPQSILVSPQSATLLIRVTSAQPAESSSWDALRAALVQQLSGSPGLRVIWDVHYAAGIMSPHQYIARHWPDLVSVFSRSLNLSEAYLALSQCRNGESGKLQIALPNSLSLDALRRQSGDKVMGRLLGERVGQSVSVRLEVGDCGDALKRQEALYQQRIREELERMTDEPAAETGVKVSTKPAEVWKPVFGRKIASSARPIAHVNQEEDGVVVEGEIISFENKVLRTGRQLILMDIYDKTGTLNARTFLETGKVISPEIKTGAYVKVRGTMQHDKYSQDLCLLIQDVMLGAGKPRRTDTAAEKRVELHAHTQMSAMDALGEVGQLIARAASFGHEAVAVTDHGVVQAFPEALAAGAKHKIKVLYGMEGYLVEDGCERDKKSKPFHISLLVAEQAGVKNLYRLVSEAHLNHFYRHPKMPRSLLKKHRAGILLGTACEQGELFQAALRGAGDEEMERIAREYDYLEIMPRENNSFLLRTGRLPDEAALLEINRRIYLLGKRLGIPVTATGDVHFLEPGDEVFRSILQSGMKYDDADQQAPLYLKTTEEMLAEFAYLGEAEAREVVIVHPRAVAARVQAVEPIKHSFHPPTLPQAEEELKRDALLQAKRLYGDPLPEPVAQRLEREIRGINKNHFASLFIIARRLVQKSLADGYLVGSRGSVGSSLAATCLGITEVNPLPGHYRCAQCLRFEPGIPGKIGADLPDRECPACGQRMEKDGFDIPFEVFMGFKGDKLPDIDLNFSGEYQGSAHKYLEELFDRRHIFRAGTISTVADRIAYGFVKKYVEEHQLTLREAEINRLTRGCAGVKKTTGQHPGGIMIVPDDMDIYDFTPVQRPADDDDTEIITTHFDYHAIHDALLKLDVLGHDDPTSLKRLGDLTGMDVRSIPLDDPETLRIFSGLEPLGVAPEAVGTSIGTLGIPEFGTEFVRQMLEATRPTTFAELVRISGLSHGTDVWLNNAADLIAAKTATLSTVISVRDDIMNYLIAKGVEPALAFQIMESVRKGKGLTEAFVSAMKEKEVPSWYIDSCQKIKYMFPKAHAVAYCIMAFRIAYFKVHSPTAFYANYFSLNAESFDAELIVHGGSAGVAKRIQEWKTRQDLTAKEKSSLVVLDVAREAMARGIRFQPVSLMESAPENFKVTGERELLPPLISLSGLGLTCALRIEEERRLRPFRSLEDLSRRTGANKNVVEMLTQHKCLDLPKTDQTCLFG